ncbi:MAG: AI-2E family transporter, partial [Chloroflexi bacterium]|nr:AI-2E family transporter [Chloroflexota bacterium]
IAAGVLLIYVGAVIVFGIFGAVAVPPIVEQANQLVSNAPAYAEQAQSYFQSLSQQYPWLPVGAGDSAISQLAGQLTGAMQSGLPAVLTVLFGVLGGVLDLIMILTIALYIVLEGETLRNTAIRLLPRHQRGRVSEVVDEITTKTGQWAVGQLMLCAAIFAITLVGLLLIGAPYAFLLALVAGLLEIVPVVGPLIAAVVAVGVTVFSSPFQAMLVAGLYVFVQQVENSVLVPRIMEHAVGISPLTVIVALAVGGSLAGIVGAILAVPVAAAIQVMLGAILRGDVDPSVHEDGSVGVDVKRNPVAGSRARGA